MENKSFVYGIAHIAEQHLRNKPILDDFYENQKFFSCQKWKNYDEAELLELTLEVFSANSIFTKWLCHHFPSKEHVIFLNKLLFTHLKHCKAYGGVYLTKGDDDLFPQMLKDIPTPPLGISLIGALSSLHQKKIVSIVGSRKASHEALAEAFLLGRLLSEENICVVSGGAYGCDIAAHRGCLATKEKNVQSVVVLAGGLGVMYPSGNLLTFKELLLRGGTILSERLWYERPRAYDFPRRNRIISGLAHHVALIHAGVRSGAMSTCRHTIEQGKELFVLSPFPKDLTMDGNYQLIEEGASLFYSAEEFVRHYLYA